jgi:hypothetical protein
LPWLQAKLTHYFLGLQLAVYELSHGKIPVPPAVFPPAPISPPEGLENDEYSKQVIEIIKKHYHQFTAAL